jgi:hypothetical protein
MKRMKLVESSDVARDDADLRVDVAGDADAAGECGAKGEGGDGHRCSRFRLGAKIFDGGDDVSGDGSEKTAEDAEEESPERP